MSDPVVDALEEALRLAAVNPNNSTSEQQRAWQAEMRLKGIDYSIPLAVAAALGWTLAPPRAGAGNGSFVVVSPAFGSMHRHVAVASLGSEFNNIRCKCTRSMAWQGC